MNEKQRVEKIDYACLNMQRRLEMSIKHAVILAYPDRAFIGGKLLMIGMVSQV